MKLNILFSCYCIMLHQAIHFMPLFDHYHILHNYEETLQYASCSYFDYFDIDF